MADSDLIIDPSTTSEPSEAEKRIKQLSGKVREEAEAREVAQKAREESDAKTVEALRERDFYANFTDVVATNPAAKDHKDEILTKVKGGYTLEDATFAVLGKAGKLGQAAEQAPSPLGGSATTSAPQTGATKALGDMTRDEKRNALIEAERRGDIALS